MDERARIELLARTLGVPAASAPGVVFGIGDDAAVLDPAGLTAGQGRLVWTIDEQVEGAHFRRDLASWQDVGWRSLMAATSDVAAMGAKPWCALCALVLPDDVDDAALEQIALGQAHGAPAAGAPIVGGNLGAGAGALRCDDLGPSARCAREVRRVGASPGDGLWLAGRVGLAAAGLRALESGRGGDVRLRAAVEAWRTPRALVAEGLAMAAFARACVDVSDGLARDVGHLADASAVRVVLDEAALRGDPALEEAAAALGADALDLALYGGEDYALAVASPVPIDGFRAIGHVATGAGLALRAPGGERAIDPRGYDHFAAARRA